METLLPGLNAKLDAQHSSNIGNLNLVNSNISNLGRDFKDIPSYTEMSTMFRQTLSQTLAGFLHHASNFQNNSIQNELASSRVVGRVEESLPADAVNSGSSHSSSFNPQEYRLHPVHFTVLSMWEEWHGIGIFTGQSYYPGGLMG
jgi:hypothetical protein